MKKFTLIVTLLISSITGWSQACPSGFSIAGNGLMTMTFASAADRGIILSVDLADVASNPKDTLKGIIGGDTGPKNWKSSTAVPAAYATSGEVHMHVIRGTLAGDTSICSFSSGATPLPIELMYFKGKTINDVTILTWATASEQNNSHFTIERSIDNVNWTIVGIETGAGNSINILNYELTDHTPVIGTVYYRLRQDDYNGDYTYSNTLAITATNNIKLNIMGLYVENNNLRVSLEGNTPNEPVTICIYSLVGSVEKTQTLTLSEFTNNMVNLDVTSLTGGIYTITVTQGNTQSSGKFIK